MKFRVLGPVDVWDGGASIPLGGAKPRAVLAALLTSPGRVVSVDRLIDAVWPEQPPDSASSLIQTYVYTLRKKLAEVGAENAIQTRPPGYLIDVPPGQLDRELFETLAGEGRRHAAQGRHEAAREAFRSALGLWRGSALDGVGNVLRPEAARLEELRLSVLEERIAADLALGRETEVIGELRALVAEHPMRERMRGYLMIALYRLGLQAEALAVFEQGRELLGEELGIDPGLELRTIHEAVLRADDTVLNSGDAAQSVHRPWRFPVATATSVLAQLPPAPADFTGRATEVTALLELMSPGRAVPICVISGQAGTGKSTLAAYVAHQLAARFPDGQIYVDLRGMADTPATPDEVLARLLRELGAGPVGPAATTEELAARYRSLLAGRRVLVLLDEALDERQVRPLVPGGHDSAVLITSRNRLAGLAGAALVELAVLDPAESVALLTRIVGSDRVEQELEAARRIAEQCGHLPLAIRIAGARLATRRMWSLSLLAERLSDELRRLDELAVGDQEVRAGIELSYRSLKPEAKRALRVLGLLGLRDFGAWSVAQALRLPPERGADAVELLVDAQLVEVTGIDALGHLRYRLHDLIRLFARERAESEESPAEREAIVKRVLGGWLWLIERISAADPSGAIHLRDAYPHAVPVDRGVAEAVLANPRSWFDIEHDALVTGVERAAAMNLDEFAGELASALCGSVFVVRNRLQAWTRTHEAALAAARRTGNVRGEARLLAELGWLRFEQDRFAEARDCLGQALEMFRRVGDANGEAFTLASLGTACREQGRFAEALRFLNEARTLCGAVGDDAAIGLVTRVSGSVHLEVGDYPAALADLEISLAAYRRAGSRRGEALTLRSVSLVHRARGELDIAETLAAQAVLIFQEVGDELLGAYGVQAWAKTKIRLGQTDGLLERLEWVLRSSLRTGDRFGTALAWRTLGELHLAEGRPERAEECFGESLRLWDEMGLRLPRARVLRDIATMHDLRGAHAAARAAWAEAIEIFQAYGAREYRELTGSTVEAQGQSSCP